MVDWKPKSRHVELDVSVSGCSPAYVAIFPSSRRLQDLFPHDFEVSFATKCALSRSHAISTSCSSFLNSMRCPCICVGGRLRGPTFHNSTTPQFISQYKQNKHHTNKIQVVVSRFLQWSLGHLPTMDLVGSVPGDEFCDESGRGGRFGELRYQYQEG
jgi:hypothetical protein